MFELIARRLLGAAMAVLVAVNFAAAPNLSKATDPAPFLETAAVHLDSKDGGWIGGTGDPVLALGESEAVPVWVPSHVPARPRAAVPLRRFRSADPTGPPSRASA